MKQYQIFAAIVCTFFITVLGVNQVHKRDQKTEITKINKEHLHKVDSLNREIENLQECLFVKKIAE